MNTDNNQHLTLERSLVRDVLFVGRKLAAALAHEADAAAVRSRMSLAPAYGGRFAATDPLVKMERQGAECRAQAEERLDKIRLALASTSIVVRLTRRGSGEDLGHTPLVLTDALWLVVAAERLRPGIADLEVVHAGAAAGLPASLATATFRTCYEIKVDAGEAVVVVELGERALWSEGGGFVEGDRLMGPVYACGRPDQDGVHTRALVEGRVATSPRAALLWASKGRVRQLDDVLEAGRRVGQASMLQADAIKNLMAELGLVEARVRSAELAAASRRLLAATCSKGQRP